jgi:glutamine amidotransferase
MQVGIIDYGVGNLGSVYRALEEIGIKAVMLEKASALGHADKYILPGVGNFTDCMRRLNEGGWSEVIREEVLGRSKPLLGICVGMQLLANSGTEGASTGGRTSGLGLIPGEVVSMKSLGCSARVPHMGWNAIDITSESRLLEGIASGTDFYFVHSYTFTAQDRSNVNAVVDYTTLLAAVISSGHVWGTQFHPEKSSLAGFRVLTNFTSDRC